MHKIMLIQGEILLNLHIKHQNVEKCDSVCGMFVGNRWADLSISETADLSGFP